MTTSGWALHRIVEPAVEPLTVEEAKVQCEIDADITDRDELLARYIKAAREHAEEYTRRTFVESTWRLTAKAWPYDLVEDYCGDYGIVLPKGPILGIVEISYLNSEGTRTYLTTDDWLLEEDEPPRILPAYNTTWPSARYVSGSIEITYRAGYPSAGSPVDAENVPAMAKQAIAMLVAHWFNQAREATAPVMLHEVPHGFYDTLQPLRIYP
jgi:uncharacterized phiE125 gp8 family phage protein